MLYRSFPSEVGDNGTRYVFFKSLLHKSENRSYTGNILAQQTGLMGRNYLKKNFNDDNSFLEGKMKIILEGLKTIADIEYQKEMAYINTMKKKLDSSIFKLSIPSSPKEEWSNFITYLNFARGNSDHFFDKVREELNRVEENKSYMNRVEEQSKKMTSKQLEQARRGYRRSKNYKTTEFLLPLFKGAFGEKTTKNSYANIIREYILRNNWDAFINEQNGRLNLDYASLNAILIAATQLVLQKLLDQKDKTFKDIFGEKNSYESRSANFKKWMDDYAEQNGLTKELQRITQDSLFRKMLTNNYIRKLNIKEIKNNSAIKDINTRAASKNKRVKDNKRATENYQKILNETLLRSNYIEYNSALKQPKGSWIINEVEELLNFSGDGDSLSFSMGDSSIKVDNLFLEITPHVDENFLKQQEQKIHEAYSPALTEEELYSTDISTTKWKARQKNINNYIEDLSRILKEEHKLKDLSESFIIESSDKMYESLGAKTSAFSGGEFGGNLNSQINKIVDLAETGGISIGDRDWLISAIINTHQSTVIGTSMKKLLQDYLSVIASAILFDDGEEIMKQITLNAKQAVSSTSVNVLHLFYLQGIGYYPLSQVLYGLYDKLTHTAEELEAMTIKRGGGTSVSIHLSNYPKDESPYENLSLGDWKNVGEQAQEGASLKLVFLAKFLDILEGLANPGI